jgi:glycyl-tRNA synthetase beta chain
MTTKSLLVELFVEELPPKALKKLGEAFAAALADGLKAQGLATEHSAVTPFASPRRLAAHVSSVRAQADDKAVRHKLMPASVAFDASGQVTPAAKKKLASLGADESALNRLQRAFEGKAELVFFDSVVKGATLRDGLQKALADAIAKLPIAKVMQYQLDDGWTSVNFVRPAHGLVALHGADLVPVRTLGLEARRETMGHRFEAPMTPVVLQDADHYARQLEEQGAVVASFAARHGEIARQLHAAAAKQGLTPIEDAALLDEVTALVERPNVLVCEFEREFLEVPQECLILTMKANQKYFPLLDAAGRLTNKFLVVSNIRPEDASRVIGGNERVVRPRLADAKFFFDQDRKRTLASRVAGLDKVVYHAKLGTMGERVERVRAIARAIGRQLGGEVLAQQADQAAMLAKADLLTDMVGEFPELQGIMGCYYAKHDGLSDEVAFAIEDHYKPRFAGDALPRNRVGVVLALADKLETLFGLFSIGEVPSGDKDPFALRRHAIGLSRLVIESDLPIGLSKLLEFSTAALQQSYMRQMQADRLVESDSAVRSGNPHAIAGLAHRPSVAAVGLPTLKGECLQTANFVYDRLAGMLKEQGHDVRDVEAVLSLRPEQLAQIPKRLAAVRSFRSLAEATSLSAANKRVGNILRKSEASVEARVIASRLTEPAEIALNDALVAVKPVADAAFERGDYTMSLKVLAALGPPVDAFFDQVMVNAEDPALRVNRLGLLAQLHAAMNRVADLSKLAA